LAAWLRFLKSTAWKSFSWIDEGLARPIAAVTIDVLAFSKVLIYFDKVPWCGAEGRVGS
jgi:hypothetical protein